MTTTDTSHSAVTAYLDGVRLYLSDLPEWDIEDLMADIEQHVIEVALEWEGPITSILGDPISFVDEYRRSADVPVSVQRETTPSLVDRLVRTIEHARKGSLWLSIRSFAKEARPGWWALRGYMACSVLLFILGSSSVTTMVNPLAYGPLGLVPIVGALALSVHLGRRSQNRSWRRWFAIGVNVAVVAGTLMMGMQVNEATKSGPFAEAIFEDMSEQIPPFAELRAEGSD